MEILCGFRLIYEIPLCLPILCVVIIFLFKDFLNTQKCYVLQMPNVFFHSHN